jgi:uracil permease
MLILGLGGAAFRITQLTVISGMALAAVAGVILNLILPEEKPVDVEKIKKT